MKAKRKQSVKSSRAPDITYIVSAFNRPDRLPTALWSLAVQSHRSFHVIVTDNAPDKATALKHREVVETVRGFSPDYRNRFSYLYTGDKIAVSDPYWSAEYAIKHFPMGQWLCFPCDDTYYVPDFGRRMLVAAHEGGYDMVICGDCVIGPECNGEVGYKHWKMVPTHAAKTSYIVRASRFPGFTHKPKYPGPAVADWALSGQIANVGILRDQLMIVHN